MEQLAINGGPKTKSVPYNQPNKYSGDERALLLEVLDSGKLMGPGGKVADFEADVCRAFHPGFPFDHRADRVLDIVSQSQTRIHRRAVRGQRSAIA